MGKGRVTASKNKWVNVFKILANPMSLLELPFKLDLAVCW